MSGSGLFVKNPKSNAGIVKKRDILLSSYLNENEPMTEAGKPCQLMPENDNSWLQEDGSWRRTTAHGGLKSGHQASGKNYKSINPKAKQREPKRR